MLENVAIKELARGDPLTPKTILPDKRAESDPEVKPKNKGGETLSDRTRKITVRATEKELEKIKVKVKRSELTQNDYILHSLLNKEIIVIEDLKPMLLELKRIGNNLNQLTKISNSQNTVNDKELQKISEELGEVWQLLRQFNRKPKTKT